MPAVTIPGVGRVNFPDSMSLEDVQAASAKLASGVGIEPRGLFLGTYAVGVYAEAGMRQMTEGVNAFQATVGLTFRTPLVFSP